RMGGRIKLDSEVGRGSTFEVSLPLDATGLGEQPFAAPDLTGQSILLVTPESIEASLVARRLQHWGGQTCTVTDPDVGAALLPERSWHALLIDQALGADVVKALSEAALRHATRRIVLFTPTTRQELKPCSALTGYLIKPLRAASLAARLSMAPEIAAPGL